MAYRKDDIPKVKLDIPNAPKFDLGDLTESMSNMDRLFDNIAKDIQEQKENAIAMEFTKCIGELLRKNGVVPKVTEYTAEFDRGNTFECRYGVSITELNFSEHDKVFEDKIAELKQRIAELESRENIIEVRVPASPIEIATHLINNTCTINELKMIAEHINVYCNGGK